jgi:drug/metabolite transporter (DMT)-like permease
MPLIILAALIYGAVFPVNRISAEAGWPPLTFSFLQSLGGAVVLAAIALIRGERIGLTRAHLMAYVVIGGLVVGLPMGLLVTAAPHLDPSVLTLVLCLSPILTLFIGIILRIETFDRRIVLGMILGIVGIGLIVAPQTGIIAPEGAGWFALSLGAPVMFATANNLAQYVRPAATGSLAMAAGTLADAALVALVVLPAVGQPAAPLPITAAMVGPLAAAAAINAAFYVLFFEIIRRVGPAKFSFFNYLAVAAGILWSLAVFREPPPGMFWIAILVMFGGMAIALRKRTAELSQ